MRTARWKGFPRLGEPLLIDDDLWMHLLSTLTTHLIYPSIYRARRGIHDMTPHPCPTLSNPPLSIALHHPLHRILILPQLDPTLLRQYSIRDIPNPIPLGTTEYRISSTL